MNNTNKCRTTNSVRFSLSTSACSRDNLVDLQHYKIAALQSFEVFLKIKIWSKCESLTKI